MLSSYYFFFFFNDTATTEIYTLSLHDALPISTRGVTSYSSSKTSSAPCRSRTACVRSEEHTSELQSQSNLVCRLLLEKKKNRFHYYIFHVAAQDTSSNIRKL